MSRGLLYLVPALLIACETGDRQLIRDLPATASFHVPALQREAHVVRTEADVPHIYAATRHDAAYVLGFTTARDRFFMMDLARRLGRGRISELLGDAGLASDLQSRISGMTYLADQIDARLPPVLADHLDAFAAGVNDYLARCQAGELPPPTEFEIAYPFLGAGSATELMKPFERRDLAAIVAVTVYNSSFEPGDIRRAAIAAKLPSYYAGAADEALRKEGLVRDVWAPVAPLFPVASAPGLGTTRGHGVARAADHAPPARRPAGPRVPLELLDRLNGALERMQRRMNRDRVAGYGSNAWAVARYATANGNAVMAGDGHLSLAVPSILYQFGLDTTVFGDGELHQLGLSIPGFPIMPIGTNGHVAWSQTQLGEDITDWYREEIAVDAAGVPTATRWGDAWMPLTRIDETFQVAAIPALGSKGRTETWSRFITFDGRWLADYEGRVVKPGEAAAAGETVQYSLSGYVVPADQDGDGVRTAISFNYAGHHAAELLASTDALGHADDVEQFREATRGLVAYSQNFAVSDWHGNILYSSYQAVPCRSHLPRNPDGSFAAGADPTMLIDGTRHGGWRLQITDGLVDESDPQACVVPFEQVPQSINPNTGYVVTANNDPGGLSFDGSVFNDAVYLGGPWDEGFRADTISRALRAQIAANRAGVEGMAEIQANVDSRLGELFTPALLAAIDKGRTAGAHGNDPAALRLSALYGAEAAAFDEVQARLAGWRERGFQARSGVRTFYKNPDEGEVLDSVATMIFNVWIRKLKARLLDDEGIGEVLGLLGGEVQVRLLAQLLAGRGDAGQALLASWHPERKESVFFDDLRTPTIETSDEVILSALTDALAFLRAPPDKEPGTGGFGSSDMSTWRWGLRHQVKFESLIADYIRDPALSIITSQLEINTEVLPLAPPGETLESSDPRGGLHWFPRDGDQYSVDAANPGLEDKPQFSHGSGPVMRMVFELSAAGVRGLNVIPGGQSGRTSSPHYADQARLWLGNRAYPTRFDPRQVVAGATGHEVFSPE